MNSAKSKLCGIYENGYCVLPRRLMTSALTPQAKTLYAYMTLYEKSKKENTLPREETLRKTLNMSHACYLKHRRTLVEAGLVSFSQPKQKNANGRNIYSQAHFTLTNKNIDEGYGIVARSVILDHSLCALAKAMYCLICSYAPASTDSDRSVILPSSLIHASFASPSRCARAINELVAHGYVTRVNGGRKGCIYIINLNKARHEIIAKDMAYNADNALCESNEPHEKQNCTNDKNIVFCTAKTNTAKNDTLNNNTQLFNKYNQVNQDKTSKSNCETAKKAVSKKCVLLDNTEKRKEPSHTFKANTTVLYSKPTAICADFNRKMSCDDIKSRIDAVSMQIEADILREVYGDDITDSILMTIADISEKDPDIRIGKRNVSAHNVREVYSKLRFRHIEAVLKRFCDCADIVTNKRAYIMTCLYNALTDYGIEIAAFSAKYAKHSSGI